MWYYKTVKGILVNNYILTDTGKYIWLNKDESFTCNGYFLIKFKGETWDLLRILEIKDDD